MGEQTVRQVLRVMLFRGRDELIERPGYKNSPAHHNYRPRQENGSRIAPLILCPDFIRVVIHRETRCSCLPTLRVARVQETVEESPLWLTNPCRRLISHKGSNHASWLFAKLARV